MIPTGLVYLSYSTPQNAYHQGLFQVVDGRILEQFKNNKPKLRRDITNTAQSYSKSNQHWAICRTHFFHFNQHKKKTDEGFLLSGMCIGVFLVLPAF